MSCRSVSEQFASPYKKSVVWRVFTENVVDRSKADCNLCGTPVSRGGASVAGFTTTNLWTHLLAHHGEDYRRLRVEEKSVKNAASTIVRTPRVPRVRQSQPRINEASQRSTKYAFDDPKAVDITRLILEMIALDNLPFDFVENVGFQRLMAHMDQRYQVPSAKYFRMQLLPSTHGAVQQNVQQKISGADHVSFTTDTWSTPHSTDSLISLTAHWIDNEWCRHSAILHAQHIESIITYLAYVVYK